MFFNSRDIIWLLPGFLVLMSVVCAFPGGFGDKQVNLKIGFDLTQEVNGEPALRVREFEDTEKYPRTVDTGSGDKKHAADNKHIRADSFSNSDEEPPVKEVKAPKKAKRERDHGSSKEASKADNGSAESDSDERRAKSTQGIRSGDYDPDDTGKVHGRDVEDDTE